MKTSLSAASEGTRWSRRSAACPCAILLCAVLLHACPARAAFEVSWPDARSAGMLTPGLVLSGSPGHALSRASRDSATTSRLRLRPRVTVSAGELYGIREAAGWGAHGSLIAHNVFEDNLNVAIRWNEQSTQTGETVIEHNVLRRTGTVPGYGGSGPWHAAGIIISGGTNMRVRYNTIDGTGYAGRLGIFELLPMSQAIRRMVMAAKSADQRRNEFDFSVGHEHI